MDYLRIHSSFWTETCTEVNFIETFKLLLWVFVKFTSVNGLKPPNKLFLLFCQIYTATLLKAPPTFDNIDWTYF